MSSSLNRPVILWDAMDTLVKDPFRDAMPRFFSMTLAEMLASKHPTAWSRFELGELAEPEFMSTFFRDLRHFDTEAFKACVRNAYAWIDGIEDLLAELRAAGVNMHVLSNYPAWYEWIEERLRVSEYVPWTFVSCRTKVRKPNPEAFLRAARDLGVEARECVFIDDRAVNCDAARAVGMSAIHFEGNVDDLRGALAPYGLVRATYRGPRHVP